MKNPERPPSPQLDLVDPQVICMSAVLRHNEIQDKRGRKSPRRVPVEVDSEFELQVEENDLAIKIRTPYTTPAGDKYFYPFSVDIGHYDPAQKKFLIYPELISGDEFEVIEPDALSMRNNMKSPDLNFDAEVVVNLRRHQKEVLEKNGLLNVIVERYNSRHKEEPEKIILMDEATSYYVGLTPQAEIRGPSLYISQDLGNRGIIPEGHVTVVFEGDFFQENRVPIRRPVDRMNVGVFKKSRQRYLHLEPATPREFDLIMELTQELQEHREQDPRFDTEEVALRRG